MGETRRLELPGGSIAYDDTLERGPGGQLVVCVPGMGDLRGVYRFLVPVLAAAGHRVVTMDVRGHGETSTGWADHSASAVGADVLALIGHLDDGPAHVVGGSMAAAAAVWAAAEAPALVAGIVLIGPFVRDVPQKGLRRLIMPLGARLLTLRPGFWARYYRGLYPASPPADLDQYVAALRANLAEPGRLAALRAMLGASKAAAEARIGQVRAPALVVMGTADPDFDDPRAEAELVGARLRAQVVLATGAGHYPQAELPELTGPAVVRFLAEHQVPVRG